MSDAAADFLTGSPPPRTAPLTADDVDKALGELLEAARFATDIAPSGERFVPGLSIAVVLRGKGVVYCDGLGVKAIRGMDGHSGSARPGPDTLFPCASLSKPVSATLLAVAAKSNALWDQVVYQRNGQPYQLAEFPTATTSREWLSHTSGLPDHAGDLIEDMNPSMSRDEIIRNVMQFQTGCLPGEHRYTNFGYTMGCLGAMHAMGASDWERFSAAALRDLGMARSTYVFTSAFDPGAGDRVLPHKGESTPQSKLGGWAWHVVDSRHERNPSRQAPAGSLLSTASDMAVFLEAHLAGRFGDFPPRRPRGYSLGWNVADLSGAPGFENAINGTSFSHSGAFTLGAATCLRIDPDAGVGIAVLTNGEPVGVPEFLTRIFFNRLYAQPGREAFETKDGHLDYGKFLSSGRALMLGLLNAKTDENSRRYASAAWQPIPATLPQGEVFRGHSAYYGCDVVIERSGDELVLRMGESWRFLLRCYDATPHAPLFVYQTIGENAVGMSGIRLILGGDSKVHAVIDHWLNQDPPGCESGTGVGVIRSR